MNTKAKLCSSFELFKSQLQPAAQKELAHIESFVEHINKDVLPLMRKRKVPTTTRLLLYVAAHPEYMPGGNTEGWEPMTIADINLVRFSSRAMSINQIFFTDLHLGSTYPESRMMREPATNPEERQQLAAMAALR